MTTVDWHSAIAERCKHLAGLGKLPPLLQHGSALRAERFSRPWPKPTSITR